MSLSLFEVIMNKIVCNKLRITVYKTIFMIGLRLASALHTLEECLLDGDERNHSNISEVAQWPSRDGEFHLFESDDVLNWCDAFALCKRSGLDLAQVEDGIQLPEEEEHAIEEFAWVAGRRKNFGTNWTWLADGFLDYNEVSNQTRCPLKRLDWKYGLFSTVQIEESGLCTLNNRNKYAHFLFCRVTGVTHSNSSERITWAQAQKRCREDGGRLATLDELDKKTDDHLRRYWIGLAYRPWIWVKQCDNQGFGCSQPIINFLDDILEQSRGECLSVSVPNQLKVRSCSSGSHHFLCEGVVQQATVDKAETNPPTSSIRPWVWYVLGSAGLCIIFGVIVGLIARRNSRIRRENQVAAAARELQINSRLPVAHPNVTENFHNVVYSCGDEIIYDPCDGPCDQYDEIPQERSVVPPPPRRFTKAQEKVRTLTYMNKK